ncbi:MAG: hypothetical protein PHC75_09600 [Burkholderiales bacterium]|nr:hypothetical protein [Burkholderiales bacterium]
MKKIKAITSLQLKPIIEKINELLEELNNKGIIILEDAEPIKKEGDTNGSQEDK